MSKEQFAPLWQNEVDSTSTLKGFSVLTTYSVSPFLKVQGSNQI